MSTLEQTIGGIRFKSPLVIGAGPLSDRPDLIKQAAVCGAGAVSIKQTAWSEPRPGVRKMYARRGSYFFNPSDRRLNPAQAAELICRTRDMTDIPLFVNILGEGTNVDTWVALGQQMQEAGADALELNFACPNPPAKTAAGGFQYGASMSRDPEMAANVIAALRRAVDLPIWVKFSGDGTDTGTLCRAAAKAGADGITAFCSPRGAFPIDIYRGGRPELADLERCSFGGINGAAIRPASNRVVAEAAQAVPDIPIMGGGGISTFEHMAQTIMYGASLTFIFTQVMLEGFDVLTRLNDQFLRFMEDAGYASIQEMRGRALKYIIPNSELDSTIGPPAKIDPNRCKGCGNCARIAFCRAIEMQGGVATVKEENCECCGLCASLCPAKAISF